MVYSFMLCADIMRQEDKIKQTEWNFFLRGTAGVEKVISSKCSRNDMIFSTSLSELVVIKLLLRVVLWRSYTSAHDDMSKSIHM